MFRADRRYHNCDRDLGCIWKENAYIDNAFKDILKNCDCYVIKHWFLKCSTAPVLELKTEIEEVEEYIKKQVKAGDMLEIWACNGADTKYIEVIMPDRDGLVPEKGRSY